jgi:hypothetical protein
VRWLIAFGLFSLSGLSLAELPPFDYQKAKMLSEGKRRQYDVIFFNEIETWNLNSNRYVTDSSIKRRAEFERMARDGYLPAYAALRLASIWPATRQHDPEALEMLLREAERGDASAMCAVMVTPMERSSWQGKDAAAITWNFMRDSAAKGHGGCMAWYGGALLLGNLPNIPQDRKAAMPLLLESARQGYYVAAKRLFGIRYSLALKKAFDFSNAEELERALCWGRLAQQHTNWAGFDWFLGELRDYARKNGRRDLMEQSYRFDPRRVPITQAAVNVEDCIPLEKLE